MLEFDPVKYALESSIPPFFEVRSLENMDSIFDKSELSTAGMQFTLNLGTNLAKVSPFSSS